MRDTKIFFISCILVCAFFLTSCSKSEIKVIEEPEVPAYSITSEENVSVEDFLELIENFDFPFIPSSFLDGQISATLEFLKQRSNAYKSQGIDIKRLNFTYSSKDKHGNPLTLSCRLCYPVSQKGKCDLNSITLFSNIWTPDNSFIATNFFCIDEFRAFYNAAVIIPDYQGYGSSNKFVTNYASPLTDARQSVEAFLVAKDILAKEKHASLSEDFHTDNIGVSRGGMVTLAIQKYLEDYASESISRTVNMKGSFFAELNPFFLKRFNAMKGSSTFLNKTSWYLSMPSAYENFPELMGGLSFSDFFTTEFNNRTVLSEGSPVLMTEALRLQNWNLLEQMIAWGGFSSGYAYDILNSAFCKSDGTIIESSPQWQALVRVAEETEYLSSWRLKHPLSIGFYVDDYMLPLSEVKELASDLQSRTDQPVKVVSCDFNPGLITDEATIHGIAAFYWMFYTVNHETLY